MCKIHQLIELVEEQTGRQFTSSPDYAEPGHHSPKSGIVFGDWNPTCGYNGKTREEQKRDPVSKLGRILEAKGFSTQWEDKWSTCGDCGKAVRTSSDSYDWTPYYRTLNECELICLDCIDPADYLESIEDDTRSVCPDDNRFHPEKHGYTKYNGSFETGFHAHMADDPAKILKQMRSEGLTHVVFRLAEASQFYITWEAYYKAEVTTNET